VNKEIKKIIKKYKRNLKKRLENNNEEGFQPVISKRKSQYEMSDKVSAIHCGGIGIINELVNAFHLPGKINEKIKLLKRHSPYHESDHILNMTYNIICGGRNLEDIELLRNNVAYMNSLGTKRIPDPTTAGDFLRRFKKDDISKLMEVENDITVEVWKNTRRRGDSDHGIIDVDGTIQETYGECKEGMDMSYKGKWGFSPLIITEATSGAHLYLVNRSGNKLSQEGSGEWIDKSIDVVKRAFKKTYLRGDSAFSLTRKFDEWNKREVEFIFGYDNIGKLVEKAEEIRAFQWQILDRPVKENKSGKERRKKERVKESRVREREYRNITTVGEYVSEFTYKPVKCKKEYRVIALKKILEESKGQQYLFENSRYFFYITNIKDKTPEELIRFIRGRCNHENKIEQLDNGIHALKMPAAEFNANWAYMAICMLAWNVKSWLGLHIPDADKKHEIISCEFKSFQNRVINIPCQILKTGRRITFRFLNYNPWIEILLKMSVKIKQLKYVTT
jgi:Transposase DDE domain group 1